MTMSSPGLPPSTSSDVNIISVGKLKHLNIFYSEPVTSTNNNINNNSRAASPSDIAPRLVARLDRSRPPPAAVVMNNGGQQEVQAIQYHHSGAQIRIAPQPHNNNNNAHLRGRSLTPSGLPNSPNVSSTSPLSRPPSVGFSRQPPNMRPPSAPLINGSLPISCMPSTSAMGATRTIQASNNGPGAQPHAQYVVLDQQHSYAARPANPNRPPSSHYVMLNGQPARRAPAGGTPGGTPTSRPTPPPPPPAPNPGTPTPVPTEQMVKKCANFFSTLIKLSKQKADAAKVVGLVQRVINETLTPADFTKDLQKELQSAAQPNLLPFLEKALPHLRRSLALGTLHIDEIHAPRLSESNVMMGSVSSYSHVSTPSSSGRPPPPAPAPVSYNAPSSSSKPKLTPLPRPTGAERFREAEDDLNDVTAMGGVNLPEESQRLAATDELLQSDTRPLPPGSDRLVPKSGVVLNRLKERLSKVHITDLQTDVPNLIAHAVQHRLKHIVERLDVIAEHRMETFRGNPLYAQVDDSRLQVRTIEEAEKGQVQRREDREKELLYKMSKSRSNNLEADQQERLRNKAKELQRAEQDEVRNREANEAAAMALGGARKRTWADSNPPTDEDYFDRPIAAQQTNAITTATRRARVKRVNMRDLQFLLSQDRRTRFSPALYTTIFTSTANKNS